MQAINTLDIIILAFGTILTIVGIILFVKMGTKGESSIKMFGFEFKLGGSALVIFIVGVALFLVPFIRPIHPVPPREPEQPKTISGLIEAASHEPQEDRRNELITRIKDDICGKNDEACQFVRGDVPLDELESIARRYELLDAHVEKHDIEPGPQPEPEQPKTIAWLIEKASHEPQEDRRNELIMRIKDDICGKNDEACQFVQGDVPLDELESIARRYELLDAPVAP